MSLLKKLAGETAIYGLSSIIGRVLNYLLVPFYTRIFLTGEYGIVAELYALVGFLMVLFLYRMETAFFRFGTEKKDRDKTYSTALISLISTTSIFVLLLLLFSSNITQWLEYSPDKSIFVKMFALVLGFDALVEIPFARIRLEQRPIKFAAIKLTNISLNIFFNIFFLVICPWILQQENFSAFHPVIEKIYNPGFGVGYVFLSNLIASAATFILVLPYYLKITWSFDKQLWKKMFAYSSPLIVAGLAGIVNEMLDRELLKHLLPYSIEENLAQIGIYAANYKLAMLMTLFIQAFRYAAEPFFFSQAKNKNSKFLYAEVGKYFAIAGAIAFLGIMLYIDFFKFFIGRNFREGLNIVPVLLLANLFLGLFYNLSIWYKLTDKTNLGAYIALIGAAITIILNVVWIPAFGYIGSAWATLICYVTMTIISYLWGQKYFPVKYEVNKIFLYIAMAIGGFFLSQFFRQNFDFSLVLTITINTIIFIAYLSGIWWQERKNLLKWK